MPLRYHLLSTAALLVLLAAPSHAQNHVGREAATGTLTVTLTGFEHDTGTAAVRLDSSEATFIQGEHVFRVARVEIREGEARVTFTDVPYGRYALSAFHDENENEQLDTGAFGIPLEPYGFSNDARGRFGPPSYQASAFSFSPDSTSVTIRLR